MREWCGIISVCSRPKYHSGHCGGFRRLEKALELFQKERIKDPTPLTPSEIKFLHSIESMGAGK